jgi:hypothetical protein
MKKYQILDFALILAISMLSVFGCSKNEAVEAPDTTTKDAPKIPDGNRIIIHFGTSTYRGCMYSFSNCIWIGWDTKETNYEHSLAVQFGNGDAAGQYFGQYFPLTDDYVVDKALAQELGMDEQVIPAGFYKILDASSGLPTGKRMVAFSPEFGQPVARLVNPNNPQDNIGQLHNLAVQVVLHDNSAALQALNGDKKAIQTLLLEKTGQFLAEAELPVNAADQQRAQALDVYRNYSDYAARLNETRLSANDKKTLLTIFDEAAAMSVRSPQELGNFVNLLTERENQVANNANIDNRKVVLSMLSVLKYSRYFWYWKSITSPNPAAGNPQPTKIPDWVWADVIGMELGGPIVSAVASAAVYLDQR